MFPHRHTITEQLLLTCSKSTFISISDQNHNRHCALSCHFYFLPFVIQKIICTLSPMSTRTSNFPLLIQPCTPHTSVRYHWLRRGHAETSINGSQLSEVPLCVIRSDISVELLSELPVEFALHPVHSELLLFHSGLIVSLCTCMCQCINVLCVHEIILFYYCETIGLDSDEVEVNDRMNRHNQGNKFPLTFVMIYFSCDTTRLCETYSVYKILATKSDAKSNTADHFERFFFSKSKTLEGTFLRDQNLREP